MILRNHGLLAVGQTIGQAFNNIYRLERACQTQLLAMACNSEITMPPQEVIARSNAQLTIMPSPDAKGKQPPARLAGMAGTQADARPARSVVSDLKRGRTAPISSAPIWNSQLLPGGPIPPGTISLLSGPICRDNA